MYEILPVAPRAWSGQVKLRAVYELPPTRADVDLSWCHLFDAESESTLSDLRPFDDLLLLNMDLLVRGALGSGPGARWKGVMVISTVAFTQLPQPGVPGLAATGDDADVVHYEWAQWGPENARLIKMRNTWGASNGWISNICQRRFVLLEFSEPDRSDILDVWVYDFNRYQQRVIDGPGLSDDEREVSVVDHPTPLAWTAFQPYDAQPCGKNLPYRRVRPRNITVRKCMWVRITPEMVVFATTADVRI